MKTYILLLICILTFGCASETQQKGLDKVALHYDAKTSYSKSYKKTIGSKKITTFNITVSNSKMLDTLRTDITTANIALLLFDSFTEEEKKDYNYINVKLTKNGSNTVSKIYDPEILSIGVDQSAIFKAFSEKIVTKDYAGIFKILEPSLVKENSLSNFTNYITNLIKTHGEIIDYKQYGYGKVIYANGDELLCFNGFLFFDSGYVKSYYVIMSDQIDNNYVLGYNLE